MALLLRSLLVVLACHYAGAVGQPVQRESIIRQEVPPQEAGNGVSLAATHNSHEGSSRGDAKQAVNPLSAMQALFGIGPIPAYQKPFFAMAAIIATVVLGYVLHAAYQLRLQALEDAAKMRLAKNSATSTPQSLNAKAVNKFGDRLQLLANRFSGKGGAKGGGRASGALGRLPTAAGSWQRSPFGYAQPPLPPPDTLRSASGGSRRQSRTGSGFVDGATAPASRSKAAATIAGMSHWFSSVWASRASQDSAERRPLRSGPMGGPPAPTLPGTYMRPARSAEGGVFTASERVAAAKSQAGRPLGGAKAIDTKEVRDEAIAAPRGSPTSSARVSEGSGHFASSQDFVAVMKAIVRIQTAWHLWKQQRRLPRPGQKVTLTCHVFEGKEMPNVNRFGGCDPFIEWRLVSGDPNLQLRGDVDKEPLHAAQTEIKRNDLQPKWDQRLILEGVQYSEDLYVQLVLWDYNLNRNTPIGHAALPLSKALRFGGGTGRRVSLNITALPGGEPFVLHSRVVVGFGFWERQKHHLVVRSVLGLPTRSMPADAVTTGTVDATAGDHVEIRLVAQDPRNGPFNTTPNDMDCLWRGMTPSVPATMEPVWNSAFEFLAMSDPSLWLQLVLWQAGAPVGHATLKLSAAAAPVGGKRFPAERQLRLLPMPGEELSGKLAKARAKLLVRLAVGPALEEGNDGGNDGEASTAASEAGEATNASESIGYWAGM